MLVTINQLKTHLRIDDAELEDQEFLSDITFKCEQASQIVLKYLRMPEDSFLDSSLQPVGVPFYISAAVLIYTGILFKHRDGEMDESLGYGQLPRSVTNLLIQWRQCTVA